MHWIAQTMIATVCFAAVILILSQLARLGISTTIINFYFFVFTAAGFVFFGLVVQRTSLAFPVHALSLFTALGCLSVVANHFAISAISTAPNPGLVRTVQSLEAVFVTIAAIFLYKARIEPRQILGIGLMIVGLVLISYRNS